MKADVLRTRALRHKETSLEVVSQNSECTLNSHGLEARPYVMPIDPSDATSLHAAERSSEITWHRVPRKKKKAEHHSREAAGNLPTRFRDDTVAHPTLNALDCCRAKFFSPLYIANVFRHGRFSSSVARRWGVHAKRTFAERRGRERTAVHGIFQARPPLRGRTSREERRDPRERLTFTASSDDG